MRHFNKVEKLAFQSHHPKPPIKYWQVWNGGQVVFEDNSPALCYSFAQKQRISKDNVKPKR